LNSSEKILRKIEKWAQNAILYTYNSDKYGEKGKTDRWFADLNADNHQSSFPDAILRSVFGSR
jgi:hypothetical protein